MGASRALVRRAFSDSRTRTLSFALLFGAVGAVQVVGYRTSYPTHADRIAFARTFGDNSAVRLFYGVPHDLLTVGGYTAWRVGGILSLFAAVWGLLAAVRAMRTEEDTGRQELVLALPVSRRQAVASALAAIGAGAVILWLATFVGFVATRLPVGGSAYLALAVVSPVPVFVGIGALASQVAPNRRLALGISFGVLAIAFAVRVVADTATGVGWLRWVTPLGWVEELRPFAEARPAVLLLPLLTGLLLLALAMPIALRRDIGSGLLRTTDSAESRLFLLSSPTALALRGELGVLAGWFVGLGAFALVTGIISDSFSSGLSSKLRSEIGKLGGGSLLTPSGALSFYFLFFVVVISLFATSQVAATRHEEAEQRLETLLAYSVSRRSWLLGRLVLAALGALALGPGGRRPRLGRRRIARRERRPLRDARGRTQLPSGRAPLPRARRARVRRVPARQRRRLLRTRPPGIPVGAPGRAPERSELDAGPVAVPSHGARARCIPSVWAQQLRCSGSRGHRDAARRHGVRTARSHERLSETGPAGIPQLAWAGSLMLRPGAPARL